MNHNLKEQLGRQPTAGAMHEYLSTHSLLRLVVTREPEQLTWKTLQHPVEFYTAPEEPSFSPDILNMAREKFLPESPSAVYSHTGYRQIEGKFFPQHEFFWPRAIYTQIVGKRQAHEEIADTPLLEVETELRAYSRDRAEDIARTLFVHILPDVEIARAVSNFDGDMLPVRLMKKYERGNTGPLLEWIAQYPRKD